jgi:DNA primase
MLLSQAVSLFFHVQKRGSSFVAQCPFHKDSVPTLMINDRVSRFKCFACNEEGDAQIFILKILSGARFLRA